MQIMLEFTGELEVSKKLLDRKSRDLKKAA